MDDPLQALKIAVLLRAGLRHNTPENKRCRWDARIAVGIGEVELNIAILIRLLFAHFLADFLFQTDRICKGKRGLDKKGLPISNYKRAGYLLLHSLIQAVLAYVLVGDWECWIVPSIIFVSHFIIDFVKSQYLKENAASFLADQFAHLTVLCMLWLYLTGADMASCCALIEWNYGSSDFWIILLGYLIVLKPTSIFLSLFIGKWTPVDAEHEGLPDAGKWIGYLERTLILTFMLTNNLEGVGFLLAAKSIFRFGELKEAKHIKITEYVLIGTLASFTIAAVVGMILVAIL